MYIGDHISFPVITEMLEGEVRCWKERFVRGERVAGFLTHALDLVALLRG